MALPRSIDVPTGLATAIQTLLIACGVTSAVTIGVEVFGLNAGANYLNGDAAAIDWLNTYDQLSSVVSIVAAVMLLATGVLWVVWQHDVAKQFSGQTRRSAGWHAGSWFIPVVSLWYPYQNTLDLWRAVGRSRPWWLIVWWLAWVIGNAMSQAATRTYLSANSLRDFGIAMWLNGLAEIFLLVAVPFAVLVVRGITRGMTMRTDPAVGQGAADRGGHRTGGET